MPTPHFVLVHGLWHGGWCWERLATILRARGFGVSAPTQTGLGERAHLLNADITLNTFIDDIVNHILFEDLNDVILVGHSFGGAQATGVVDRIPERIAHLVYLDGIMLKSGECWMDLLPPDIVADRTRQAEDSSQGLSLPPAHPTSFGVTDPDDIAFLLDRLTPHPFATLFTPLNLHGPVGNDLPTTYIECTDPAYAPAKIALERAKKFGWPIKQIATGHDAMVCAPQALADILIEIV